MLREKTGLNFSLRNAFDWNALHVQAACSFRLLNLAFSRLAHHSFFDMFVKFLESHPESFERFCCWKHVCLTGLWSCAA